MVLDQLLTYESDLPNPKFRENIRALNTIFAFTSMGGTIDKGINNGGGPYVFRINGQNHHKIGSLLPTQGRTPKFAQLYIYDTDNEVANRLKVINRDSGNESLESDIVNDFMKMFDEHNELVKAFRMARDRFQETDMLPVRVKIGGQRNKDGRQYNLPTSSEVAALIVGDFNESNDPRDVIVEHRTDGTKRISELHPSFMAMQYPILFPYGEDGFRLNIPHRNLTSRRQSNRKHVTMQEYYAFRLQQRRNEGQTLLRGGKLFQQYIVDAYTCIEANRLFWITQNQRTLKAELYKGLKDAVLSGDSIAAEVGKRMVLPSTFTGGP